MSFGPIELVVINFPGNKFNGEVAPALGDLIKKGVIRVIDIIFATKDKKGHVEVVELSELDDQTYKTFEPLVSDVEGLMSQEDVASLTESMANNSSAGIMLFENTWAAEFTDAVASADGEVVMNARIPRQVIEKVQEKMEKEM